MATSAFLCRAGGLGRFFGCTIVFGLPMLGELLRPLWQLLWNHQPTLLGLRFVVSFLILTPPDDRHGFNAASDN